MSERFLDVTINSPYTISNKYKNVNIHQPFVNFFRKGQIVTKEMLNDQFIRSIMFDMSKRYTRFVSGTNYLSYGYHGTSILGEGNYTINYDEYE
jgi:hypothetical protein